MNFNISCPKCQKTFVAATDQSGTREITCLYCGKNFPVRFEFQDSAAKAPSPNCHSIDQPKRRTASALVLWIMLSLIMAAMAGLFWYENQQIKQGCNRIFQDMDFQLNDLKKKQDELRQECNDNREKYDRFLKRYDENLKIIDTSLTTLEKDLEKAENTANNIAKDYDAIKIRQDELDKKHSDAIQWMYAKSQELSTRMDFILKPLITGGK